MFAHQIVQWFNTEERQPDVKVGAVFRKKLRGGHIEIAEVIDITPDPMGVPHVLFMVSIQSPSQQCFREQRTLGLATFSEQFVIPSTA